jgi:hypothetical protein
MGEAKDFRGAVMSRRQPRQTRAQQVDDKEKGEAEAFPMDSAQVLAKKPDARLKWLQKGLMYASKKYVQIADIFDISTNKKFMDNSSVAIAKQIESTLLANLHTFSTKQQRFLLSDASGFKSARAGDAEDSDSESFRKEDHGRSASRSRSRDGFNDNARRGTVQLDFIGNSRASRLAELFAGNSQPLRPPPMVTAEGIVSRYPFPLPDIFPGEDVRKYAFGTADDFLTVGDDIAAYDADVKGDLRL